MDFVGQSGFLLMLSADTTPTCPMGHVSLHRQSQDVISGCRVQKELRDVDLLLVRIPPSCTLDLLHHERHWELFQCLLGTDPRSQWTEAQIALQPLLRGARLYMPLWHFDGS